MLTDEFIDAHYPKSQHQPDECEACHDIYEQAKEANALRASLPFWRDIIDECRSGFIPGCGEDLKFDTRKGFALAEIDAALKPSPAPHPLSLSNCG